MSYREIDVQIKEFKLLFVAMDVADLVQYLQEKGVKVWH